jgi:glycosyltransferase involved in cell wall biosynthesis
MMSAVRAETATICTIIAKNYLAQARCLAESFYAQHPTGRMFALLVDQPSGCFDPAAEPFTSVSVADLAVRGFAHMAFRYNVVELSTAVKPFFIEYLFDRYDLDHLIYLDPDIYCYRPLTPLLDGLRQHRVVLTPHLLAPLDDEYRPNELDLLLVGSYNLGCIGLARNPELHTFLRWWQRHLERDCVIDLARGLFVDQRWIDMLPALFDGVAVVRDPGCNVAYWNLAQRDVTPSTDGWLVNGQPLTFYHFSGLMLEDIDRISLHQNRYTLAKLPKLRPLFRHYHSRLLAHGVATARHWSYGYGAFANGVPIAEMARQLWRDNDGEHRWPQPFDTSGPDSFFSWLNQEAHADAGQPLLSNLALEVYRQRVDLQQAFTDVIATHRRAYIDWFIRDAAAQHQIDAAFVEPMRQALAQADAIRPALASAERPPAGHRRRLLSRFAALEPLPEAPLNGEPALSRRIYYSIRNPLRRLGLHTPIKRLIGGATVAHIQAAMVLGSTKHLPVTRTAQSRAALFTVAPAKAPGLNVVGYFEHLTGVGEVARALLRTLETLRYPAVGIETPQNGTGRAGSRPGPYSCNLLCVNADATPYVWQSLGAAFFDQRYTIGFWHWEIASFPSEWYDRFALLQELWVASEFVQQVLAPLVSIPIHRMRIPIAIPAPALVRRADLGLPNDRFIWLFAFDMRSYIERKNPFGVIESYRRAFGSRSSRTHLVIKASHLEEYPDMAARLHASLAEVGGTLIRSTIDRSRLTALFAACDGYLSLHRSEGFGLTLIEAMALGKPVVATGYSGNMDFMTPENSYPVRYRLSELDRDYGPYQRGTFWAEPDLDHAAEQMRSVCEQRDEARNKGQLAVQDIARWYGSQSAGQAIVDRLRIIESHL